MNKKIIFDTFLLTDISQFMYKCTIECNYKKAQLPHSKNTN